ncbi:hypothetical protein BGZ95_009174 [Linnemannia exigua]|uniref:Uncharacterized protein n=1 Tax=Linnemannia exigua TaxID=604196 RepID=A0AAD4DD89_9FUNG|nr:hypothetical protein BGZ95_009174 [Linnemannia exigua]
MFDYIDCGRVGLSKTHDSVNKFGEHFLLSSSSVQPIKVRQQQDYSDPYSSGFHNDVITSAARSPTPPTAISTEVFRARRTPSSTRSNQFLQRMESTVQLFEQSIREGQLMQAKAVQQEAEPIKKEMAQCYGSLQDEVAKNTTTQEQVKVMVVASEKMTKRILELQEAPLDTDKMMLLLQQQAQDRLADSYSHPDESRIPRLFIILPMKDMAKREKIGAMIVKRFRLYFLCECGEHTRPVGESSSSLSHDIHLARHEGYDLDRPDEFFRKYGSYVLALLQMLKYGVIAAGMTVTPLNALKVADELTAAEAGLKVLENVASRVDSAIEYLQDLTAAQESVPKDLGNSSSTATWMDPVSIGRLEGLEGVDLRHLGSFLKASDEGKVTGNLYRTVTPKGHVKWVCLDHYRESHGAAALQGFKEMVKLSDGKYDQRTGRVTMHLESPDRAKQFYAMLLSTRLVHELDLTLDWSASSEDLRILRDAMQQSNIYHLGLNLCDNALPTPNIFHRSRRVEPILQIMASGKIQSMGLMNTIGFLSLTKDLHKTISAFHFRHFDLGERVVNDDDFAKLENLIRASPMLIRLGVVVGDMDGAFSRLKPLVAQHKTLSILDLQLQDGTAASVKFEQGSDRVIDVRLKVVEPSMVDWMKMPKVTSVELLTKDSFLRSADVIHAAVKELNCLEKVKIMHLPDGGSAVLRNMQRAIHDYCSGWKSEEDCAQDEALRVTTVDSTESIDARSRFMELESLHKQSVLLGMEVMVALTERAEPESETTDETLGETLGKSVASATGIRGATSVFASLRQDGSLAMVRFESSQNGSNSTVLHVGDFEMSKVFHHSSVTRLMLVGQRGAKLFNEMIKAPSSTGRFRNLKTVEFDCKPQEILSYLQVVQLARAQCPALTKLHLWNASHDAMEDFGVSPSRTLITYDLILRKMDFGDYFVSQEEISNLRKVFRGSPLLSEMKMTVPTSAVNNSFLAECEREVFIKRQNGATVDGATERNVMHWMMSTSTSVTPESAYASSIYSGETTDVHFRWLRLPTESEAE